MAVARNPNYCFMCGELIKERHQYMGKHFCGDTFIGYEPHVCDQTTDKYKKWVDDQDAYHKTPERLKEIESLKRMFENMRLKEEAEAKEAEKTKRTQMNGLNEFLRELADNDKVGIRRKLVAIKRYIAYIENGSTNK
jgi:hypothetical protein